MRISGLLQAKGAAVHTIAPTATVTEALGQLCSHGVGALVVSGDGVHIDGIVSERDVVRRLNVLRGALVDEPVTAIMSAEVHTAHPDDEIESLMAVMTDRRVRHVPVVDEHDALVGIVSIGDVVKSRIDELEKDRNQLVDYIHAR